MNTIYIRIKAIISLAILALVLLSTATSIYAQSKHASKSSNAISSQALLQSVLPSIVIVDSERISYTTPYEQQDIPSLFFPLTLQRGKATDLQGDGISKKELFGSGVFIKKTGTKYYLLSNNHVVEQSTNIWVTTYDGIIHSATLEGTDPKRDIALLSIHSEIEYPLIATIASPTIQIGTPVYVIGSPYGFTFSVSKGIISASNRTDSTLENIFFQTDATMNPGNSGGALINEQGELIGISTWIYSPKSTASIGLNFASSIDTALKIVENIIHNLPIEYGWIGIVYDSFSVSALSNMAIDYRFGSIITNIVADSPADKAKLQIGDIIVAINNQKVHAFNENLNNTTALISTLGIDAQVELTIYRNLQTISITTTTIAVPTSDPMNTNTPTAVELHTSLHSNALHTIASRIKPGMVVVPLEEYKKELYGLEDNQFALLVEDVISGSPADKAKINTDDIIIALNGTMLEDYQDYLDTVNESILNKKDLVVTIQEAGTYRQLNLPVK